MSLRIMSMKKKVHYPAICIILLVLISLTSTAAGETTKQETEPQSSYPYLRIISNSSEKIVLEFTPAYPEIYQTNSGTVACEEIAIGGLYPLELEEGISLPVQGALIGIPDDSMPEISLVSVESEVLLEKIDLCPVSQPVIDFQKDGIFQLNGYSETNDNVRDDVRKGPVEIIETGRIRSQRYVQLRFNPIQYDQSTGLVTYYKNIWVEIKLKSKNARLGQPDELIDEGYFEEILGMTVLNYEQAKAWRIKTDAYVDPLISSMRNSRTSDAYKILTDQEGIYEVTYESLQSVLTPVDLIDPATFKLMNQENEVAVWVVDDEDEFFEPGERILFFAEKISDKYTETNVYWLTWNESDVMRMGSVDGAPSGSGTTPTDYLTTMHLEEDLYYLSAVANGELKDHWYWGEVYAVNSTPDYMDINFNLFSVSSEERTATLRGLLKGYSATPYHNTRIYINGNQIDDQIFSSGRDYSFDVSFPQSYLNEGSNILRIECPLADPVTYDDVLINWFELDYYHGYFAESDKLQFDAEQDGLLEFQVDGFSTLPVDIFDITLPKSPVRILNASPVNSDYGQKLVFDMHITGEHKYLSLTSTNRLSPVSIHKDTPSNLRATTNGADYIIISHADFIDQVQPLADHRTAKNMRVAVVDVQDVYDEFNSGIFDPGAIKDFLAYTYQSWASPAPSFVLLVGDGHYDFKNLRGYNNPILIPPYLDDVDPWIGETATDNRYVSISGTDILPDMNIGRLPVRTPTEATTLIQKIINYETDPEPGEWTGKQLFIADNWDSGGNFPVESDKMLAYIPSSYTVDKVYYSVNYTNATAARTAIQTAINNGRLIVHYAGHGSPQQWAGEGLFRYSDIPLLANGIKQPFMLPMTCAEGYFIHTSPAGKDYSSVAEGLVRADGKGAIASWSPTGYGLTTGHMIMDEFIFDQIFNHQANQLGYLTTNAKYYLYAYTTGYRDLIETYLLFGDPALRLQLLPVDLPAPSDLIANAILCSQVDLTWTDNSSDETEFRIERSPDGVNGWEQIGVVDANITNYTDRETDCLTPYYYRVIAFREGDLRLSNYSNIAEVITPDFLRYYLPLIER